MLQNGARRMRVLPLLVRVKQSGRIRVILRGIDSSERHYDIHVYAYINWTDTREKTCLRSLSVLRVGRCMLARRKKSETMTSALTLQLRSFTFEQLETMDARRMNTCQDRGYRCVTERERAREQTRARARAYTRTIHL